MAKLLLGNPRKRRTSKKRRTASSKRRSSSKGLSVVRTTKTVSRRRNPAKRQRLGLTAQITNAAIGAGGALVVDIAMAKLPFIPENLKTGPIAAATKGAVAMGIGMLVGKFGKNKSLGVKLAEGGMTVALHDAAKSMIGPSVGLSGMGEYYDMMGLGDYSDFANDTMSGFETMQGFETVDGFSDEAF